MIQYQEAPIIKQMDRRLRLTSSAPGVNPEMSIERNATAFWSESFSILWDFALIGVVIVVVVSVEESRAEPFERLVLMYRYF
jgi:hypothetical protein